MIILDGKQTSQKIREEIREKIERDYKNIKAPTLAVVLVGDDPASAIYVKNKEKACAEVGINSIVIKRDAKITENELLKIIDELNKNSDVDAILVQLPLPKHIDESRVINSILPEKDVDGLSELSMGKLALKTNKIAPCTPSGIIDLLKEYKISLEGKHVVIVGRSKLVGRPMELLAERYNSTTTICHSKTKDLANFTKQADILIVAIGKARMITKDMVKKGAVVVDVGINRENGKIVGDVDFENVKSKCLYITPVPGGVGPMTIAELMKNTLILSEK